MRRDMELIVLEGGPDEGRDLVGMHYIFYRHLHTLCTVVRMRRQPHSTAPCECEVFQSMRKVLAFCKFLQR